MELKEQMEEKGNHHAANKIWHFFYKYHEKSRRSFGSCKETIKWNPIIQLLNLKVSFTVSQIYFDGSVIVSHGGTEMGQGLHTKTMQVASKVLDIPIELVHIIETATDKVSTIYQDNV